MVWNISTTLVAQRFALLALDGVDMGTIPNLETNFSKLILDWVVRVKPGVISEAVAIASSPLTP